MNNITAVAQMQREYFLTGETLDVQNRLARLRALQSELEKRETDVREALREDLGKCACESLMTETGIVRGELKEIIKMLPGYVRPKRVRASLAQLPGRVRIYREPYGLCLVVAPWNYPFQLCVTPLIGAVGAGNCVLYKMSGRTPHTARVTDEIIRACFPPGWVSCVSGSREDAAGLFEERFDKIFFTGGKETGKWILEESARFLTPATLELGGKSPAIVGKSADLSAAAKRIAYGKGMNGGQTCVAPDYCFVHERVYEAFPEMLKDAFIEMYGENPLENPDWPLCKRLDKMKEYVSQGKVFSGGEGDDKRFQPTVLLNPPPDASVLNEEIFGPVLPVLPFKELSEVEDFIRARGKPLALYLFSRDKDEIARVTREISFGGGCVNDTLMHVAGSSPFGGVGESGMGAYHGKLTLDTFTHEKAVVHKFLRPDVPMRYPPFTEKKKALLEKLW